MSEELLFLTGCFWDNGHLYRADQPSPSPGLRCLNWLNAQSSLASTPESGECPPWAVGGRRPRSRPRPGSMAPSLPSQAPATTATAGTQTRTRAGPGATSAARRALPRSDLARTRAAQVPASDPGNLRSPQAQGAWERLLQPPRTCGRTTPAGPAPPPRRPIGQGYLQAAGPKAHWPLQPLGVSSSYATAL